MWPTCPLDGSGGRRSPCRARGGVELGEGHARARDRALPRGVELEPPPCHSGEINDDTVAHISSPHGAAGTAGDQRHLLLRCPTDCRLQILDISRQADRARQNTVDAGTLGIGGPYPLVGSISAPDGWSRQHREKLTIFSPYG